MPGPGLSKRTRWNRGSRLPRKRAMLVLTRKLMEKLFIGDDICVTVVRLEGGQVRLGIEAPRDITVVRAELVPERQFGPSRGNQRPPAATPVTAPATPPAANPTSGDHRGEVRIPQPAAH